MDNIDLNIYEDGSLPELNIGKTIDNVPNEQKVNFLTLCCKKLAHGGTLVLQGLHLDAFCKEHLFTSATNLDAIMQLQSVTSIEDLSAILNSQGVKIVGVSINKGIYTVEATK